MAVRPIPTEYHRVTPYLVMKNAAKAIDFYRNVFDAKERMRLPTPDGTIAHAEIQIGDSIVMLSEEAPERGFRGPQSFGGTPVSLLLYVENVDTVFKKAITAGAKEMRPVKNQFYGDRSGTLTDPFGHCWTIATHVEDVRPEELQKRMQTAMSGAGDV